jgi:hypothetical protein
VSRSVSARQLVGVGWIAGYVVGPVTQTWSLAVRLFEGGQSERIPSKQALDDYFQLESLILAQNERWRQA